MAKLEFDIVQGNTAPSIQLTLQREPAKGATGANTVIDLTGVTLVNMIIKEAASGAITNTGHQGCTITSATGGLITYAPQAVDFANSGKYQADVQINYAGGSVEIMHEQVLIVARQKN